METEGWVPLSVACQRLGLPHQDVMRMVHRRALVADRRGARWYVDPQSLRKVLRRRREPPTQVSGRETERLLKRAQVQQSA